MVDRKDSNTQLLQELESLSQSLYPAHSSRRTASLALPRSAAPTPETTVGSTNESRSVSRPRSRRMSMSPFRSRPKQHLDSNDDAADSNTTRRPAPSKKAQPSGPAVSSTGSADKKGIWNWKPMRALSHIGMQKLSCLFSVQVVAVQGLPPSMNGLRLSVSVRKKETKDGAVQTMPARVLQDTADFEETLFIQCHVYCSGGSGTGRPLKLEPRPFLLVVTAIDAPELDFGRSTVDLSELLRESMEKSMEGARVRQWDATFELSGKAKGGELVLKLTFQIMEDGGVGIYNQASGVVSSGSKGSASFARRQSKASFSITSPRISRAEPSAMPTKENPPIDLKGIDDFSLDEAGPPPSASPATKKSEQEPKLEELDIPDFEVVDKGVEIQEPKKDEKEHAAAENEEAGDESSASSEVVKEVVHHDSTHLVRLTELEEIAKQIKALESVIGEGYNPEKAVAVVQEDEMQRLDAEEETVTREFLQMLDMEDSYESKYTDMHELLGSAKLGPEEAIDGEAKVYISDLGKGLGSIVQTRDGGYLAAVNPLDSPVSRKEIPKLAMQISKPLVLGDQGNGLEVIQKLAAIGAEELGSKLFALTGMDELMGKTAEQVAFEGIASAIISGRSKEGASSSAAKSVAMLKTMAAAMSEGRKERIATRIWNLREEPVTMEEILAVSLQKIEAMAVEALKIQADLTEEEAPFDVSPLAGKEHPKNPLESAVSPEDWIRSNKNVSMVALLVVVQLRDPLRRYETVGAPTIAVVQAARVDGCREDEEKFKVASLHVSGLKLLSGRRSLWDGEKQRLTAMQWLVPYGLVKAGRKSKPALAKGGQDLMWSLSARVMADMWLKPLRNPDVKLLDR